MERLNDSQQPFGFSAAVLRTWGFLFLLLGIGAKCVIQNGLLDINGMSAQALLALMDQPGSSMTLITVSLIMQALESCAVPIFALLLVEGACSCWRRCMYQAALVAAISEVPYNLAMSGKMLDLSTRNPAFGLVIALVMLWFFHYFEEKGGKTWLIKCIVTLAAVLWGGMLSVEYGTFIVLMTAVLWVTRNKPCKILVGALAAAAGCLISIYYVVAPVSFLAVHFYNGEEGEGSRVFDLICYPLLLLAGFAASIFI